MKHRWSQPERHPFKTERSCLSGCHVVKVTRHEPGQRSWIEWWRSHDGEAVKIETDRTPVCEPAMEAVDA